MSYSSNKHMTDISISQYSSNSSMMIIMIIIIIDHAKPDLMSVSPALQPQHLHSMIFDIEEQRMLEYFSTLQFYASGLR